MKRILFLFVCNIIINSHHTVTAQNLSIEETKTILCGHKWLLKTLEQDNKAVAVPEKLRGLKIVFNTDGYSYRFMSSDVDGEKSKNGYRWSITKTQLSIADNLVYSYSLKDIDGMKLYLTLPGKATFVYERDRNIITDDSDWYDLLKLDSSMEKLAARMDQEKANYKIIVGSWDLEKVSFKNTETTEDDGFEEYFNFFKAALLNAVKEGYRLTKEDKELLDLEAKALARTYFVSTVNFEETGAFKNEYFSGTLSGEYSMVSSKSLKMNWKNGDENALEIIKINSTDLILKDKDLKVVFYYKRSKE